MLETLQIGTAFSNYRIVSRIGSGGMGEVWRARDDRLDRDVAIKILPASFAVDADRLRRFEQEARATLFRKPADGSSEAEQLGGIDGTVFIKAIQPDGVTAILDGDMGTSRGNIVQMPLTPGAQAVPLVSSPFNEYASALSPDGRWLAYQSNESGRTGVDCRFGTSDDIDRSGLNFGAKVDVEIHLLADRKFDVGDRLFGE